MQLNLEKIFRPVSYPAKYFSLTINLNNTIKKINTKCQSLVPSSYWMTNQNLHLYKAFLKKEGYDVVSFTDPVLALEYHKETADKHSLIITDLRMPGICG